MTLIYYLKFDFLSVLRLNLVIYEAYLNALFLKFEKHLIWIFNFQFFFSPPIMAYGTGEAFLKFFLQVNGNF